MEVTAVAHALLDAELPVAHAPGAGDDRGEGEVGRGDGAHDGGRLSAARAARAGMKEATECDGRSISRPRVRHVVTSHWSIQSPL